MKTPHSPYAGTAVASVAAGPLFLAFAALGVLGSATDAIVVEPIEFESILFLAPVIAVGVIVSAVPNFLGTAAMLAFGRWLETGQMPILWAMAGAALAGSATYHWTHMAPIMTFAFAATGAACAVICREWAYWPPR